MLFVNKMAYSTEENMLFIFIIFYTNRIQFNNLSDTLFNKKKFFPKMALYMCLNFNGTHCIILYISIYFNNFYIVNFKIW